VIETAPFTQAYDALVGFCFAEGWAILSTNQPTESAIGCQDQG
jgi:hypothetical protein